VFILGSVLTFILMLARAIWMGSPAGEGAHAIDFLIPTISVMLAGYLEGGRAILAGAESLIEKVLLRLRRQSPAVKGDPE
jgi:hypothetical protein